MLPQSTPFFLLALISLPRQSATTFVSYSSSSSSSSSSSWSQDGESDGQPSSFNQRTRTASHCVDGVCNQAMSHRNSDPVRTRVPNFDALSTDPHRLFKEPQGWLGGRRDEGTPFGPGTSMRQRVRSITTMRDEPSFFGGIPGPIGDPFTSSPKRLKMPTLLKREALGSGSEGANDEPGSQSRLPPRLEQGGQHVPEGDNNQQKPSTDAKIYEQNTKQGKAFEAEGIGARHRDHEHSSDRRSVESTQFRSDAGTSKPPTQSPRRSRSEADPPPASPRLMKQQMSMGREVQSSFEVLDSFRPGSKEEQKRAQTERERDLALKTGRRYEEKRARTPVEQTNPKPYIYYDAEAQHLHGLPKGHKGNPSPGHLLESKFQGKARDSGRSPAQDQSGSQEQSHIRLPHTPKPQINKAQDQREGGLSPGSNLRRAFERVWEA